jgi:hypothetical protein
MHPLIGTLKSLTDSQIEEKLNQLTRNYWSTSNTSVRDQIVMMMDSYRDELQERRIEARRNNNDGNDQFDNLIKVS